MNKIGIDIGGTTIKGIYVDDGIILKRYSKPTMGNVSREAILNSLYSVVDNLLDDKVQLIGISSAGNIDNKKGVCVYATDNLKGWSGFDIKSAITQKYSIDCIVDNDAVCALKAEMQNYPNSCNLVMITFGTGIGGAVLSGGKIIRGKNFDGGRLGHMVLVPDGILCNCGKRGCVETYLSCTALKRQGEATAGGSHGKLIEGIQGVKELFRLYEKKIPAAQAVLRRFSYYLNIFLDNVRTCYAPDYIVLGGGLVKDDKILLSLIDRTEDIVIAKYGDDAGALGSLIQID